MIESRIAKLESLMNGKSEVDHVRMDALIRIKTWLGEVDRDVEFIPDADPKRFKKLLESIKENQLSETEEAIVDDLFNCN